MTDSSSVIFMHTYGFFLRLCVCICAREIYISIFHYDSQISRYTSCLRLTFRVHVHTFAHCFITVCVEATPAPCVESVDARKREESKREKEREVERTRGCASL